MAGPRGTLPARAYVPVIREHGYSLGIAVAGQAGYYATDYGTVSTWEAACKWADDANTALGVSKEDAMVILCDTMARQHAGQPV